MSLAEKIKSFFDKYFTPDEIHWTNPIEVDDNNNEYDDETRRYYFRGEILDDDIVFLVYLERNRNMVQLYYTSDAQMLDGMFAHLWEEPFKEWFETKFGIQVDKIV